MPKLTSPKKNSDTRAKILNAARKLFVHYGYSGTSMGKIALEAGANHSLLFHHFGNKENLWLEVKEDILKKGKALYSNLPAPDKPLINYLEELISRAIIFYKNNPDIVRMLNWQRLDTTASASVKLPISKETEQWLEICKIYQQRGEINPAYKPEHIMSLTFSIVGSLANDPNTFLQDHEENLSYLKFCSECLYKALRN